MAEIIPTLSDVMSVSRMLRPPAELTEADAKKVLAQMIALDGTGMGRHEVAYQRALLVRNFKKNLA